MGTIRRRSVLRVAGLASTFTLALLVGLAPVAVDPDLSRPEGHPPSAREPSPAVPPRSPDPLLVEVDQLTGQGATRILVGPSGLSLPPGRPLLALPVPERWRPDAAQAQVGCDGETVGAGLVIFDCWLRLTVDYASVSGTASHVTWWGFVSGAADVTGALPGDRVELASAEPLVGLTLLDCTRAARGTSCRRLGLHAHARLQFSAFRKVRAPLTLKP